MNKDNILHHSWLIVLKKLFKKNEYDQEEYVLVINCRKKCILLTFISMWMKRYNTLLWPHDNKKFFQKPISFDSFLSNASSFESFRLYISVCENESERTMFYSVCVVWFVCQTAWDVLEITQFNFQRGLVSKDSN